MCFRRHILIVRGLVKCQMQTPPQKRKTQLLLSWTRPLLQHQLPKAFGAILKSNRWLANPCTEWINLLLFLHTTIPHSPTLVCPEHDTLSVEGFRQQCSATQQPHISRASAAHQPLINRTSAACKNHGFRSLPLQEIKDMETLLS